MSDSRPRFSTVTALEHELFDRRPEAPSSARHVPVGGARIRGELGRIPLQSGWINTHWTSHPFWSEGLSPAKGPTVLVVEACSRHAIVCEWQIQPGDLVAYGPSVPVWGGSGGELRWTGAVLDGETWNGHARRVLGRELDEIAGAPRVLRAEARLAIPLRDALAEVVELARTSPEAFDASSLRSDIEQRIAEKFAVALAGAKPAATRPASLRRASDAVKQAVAWLHGHPLAEVPELSRVTRMPRRSLERAFHQVIGTGPADFARRDALATARELLLAGAPGTSVAGAAQAAGFSHLGRFAGYYRRAYGEAPSHTLKRARERPRR